MYIRTMMLALAVIAGGVLAGQAQAWDACGCGWGGYRGYNLSYHVPYYAAHPPVYYSIPVPRTYGYSPFPYPGSVRTPEIEVQAAPMSIRNPYVKPRSQQASQRVASHGVQPLVVENPFVQASAVVADAN